MTYRVLIPLALIAALALPDGDVTAGQSATKTMTSHVEHMATGDQPARTISGSAAQIMSSPAGVTMTMETSELTPGHVTTAWWVLITRPGNCSATPCTAEDVIGRAAYVGTQIVYADGVVNGPEGQARFSAHLARGLVENGWFAQRFDNPTEAEIHLVLNDHGPLVPALAQSMLTSYRGGCSDDSLPPPFPATAKADGIAGPNACALVQDAIFVQKPGT